jgi:hypothetical protein
MDMTMIIILVFIGLAIGVILGLLVGTMRAGEAQSSVSEETDPNLVEAARLWWNRESGGLVLETGGHNYQKASEMPAQQRERVSEAIVGLLDWLGSAETDPNTSSTTAPSISSGRDLLDEQVANKSSLNPVDVITQALDADVPQSVDVPLSIVAQIDTILQEKIREIDLKERAVRLLEVPGGGMVVLVGLNKYESIDEVPDGQVKELIRASVAEWEQMEQD